MLKNGGITTEKKSMRQLVDALRRIGLRSESIEEKDIKLILNTVSNPIFVVDLALNTFREVKNQIKL